VSAADKVVSEARLRDIVAAHRKAGRRIVLTNGAFDLLHVGHVRSLEEAATHGGVLVVAVNSDAGVRAAKGAGRPIVPAAERAELVAALACVDHVVLFEDATMDRLLEVLKPDVHAKGRDYTLDTLPERATARRLGVECAIVGDEKRHSSSALVARAGAAQRPLDRMSPLDQHGLKGLVLRDARPALESHGWLDLARLSALASARPGQRSSATRVELDGHALFLKRIAPYDRRRDPLVALHDLLALRAAGFRAPEPWLAAEGRGPQGRVGLLLTREERGLPLAEHLALELPSASGRERAAMARGLGTAVRALHTARFVLPDLSAEHLLVDGSLAGGAGTLVVVGAPGLHRAGRRFKPRVAQQSLAVLARSLKDVTTPRFRLAALRAYLAGSLRAARPWIASIRRRMARL
jgi:rfaE bifunctional protein nucleotidyltransferase chain/domain